MDNINKPTKEEVRAWLAQRQLHREQLPDRERIRCELGWKLVKEDWRRDNGQN